jgi:THO complex subunit 2
LVLNPIADVMRNQLPSKAWEDISPQFYVTFWSLTLYDLLVPNDAYSREINRIKNLSITAAENKDLTSGKRKREQERCNALIEKLQDEKKRQKEHVDRLMAKLNTVKGQLNPRRMRQ